jgi:hypothetical protein
MAAQTGLKPHEFWDMTLGEFGCYCQGYSDRIDMEMDMLAWHASIVVSPWTKKGQKVTPQKLRGKKSNKPQSGAEVLAELEQNADRLDQDAFWKKGKGREWQAQEK